VQVKKDARIYLVGLRGSVWLWELLMLWIISTVMTTVIQ